MSKELEDDLRLRHLELAEKILTPVAFLIFIKFEILKFVLEHKATYDKLDEKLFGEFPFHEAFLGAIFGSMVVLAVCSVFSFFIVVAGYNRRFEGLVTKLRMGPAINILVFLIALSFLIDILAIPVVIFEDQLLDST